MLWNDICSKHFLAKKCNTNVDNCCNRIRILILDMSTSSSDPDSASTPLADHKSMNSVLWDESYTAWISSTLFGGRIHVQSGSTEPEPQLSLIPFLDVVHRLQSHWHGDGGSVWLLSTSYISLGNPSTIISTAQRRSSLVKRRIIKMYAIDQNVFGFCIFHHMVMPYFFN